MPPQHSVSSLLSTINRLNFGRLGQWALLAVLCGIPTVASGQLVFVAGAQFGDRVGTGLFQVQNGQVAQLPTGFPEHNFPSLSRDSRFIVFSSPDGVTPALQVPPSSDIYVFDRATNQTRRVVDHETIVFSPNEVDSFTPVSAVLSPNNQLIAYGVVLTRRQGLANPRATRELNIARSSDGIILHNPTFGRGPVSDDLQSEFVGIAWDPGGESLVTPSYVTVPSGTGGVQLPAIVRFARNPANGVWSQAAVLSAPAYFDGQFPIAAQTQIYPAISPSGAGLAYFDLTWPDVLGASQPVVARLVIANADGSGARVLATFNQGIYPVGLAWAPTGTSLVFSIAPQLHIGTGYAPAADAPNAVIRTIATATGEISRVPNLDAGFFPSFGVVAMSTSGSLDGVQLQIGTSSSGQLRLTATGVDPDASYNLESSTTLESFGPPQTFTGAQLLNGIDLPSNDTRRFYRLRN